MPLVGHGPVRSNHKLQADEVAALVAAYQAGASLNDLARRFDLYKRTVHAHLVRAGIQPRPQRVLTEDQVTEIIGLYAGGATLKQLGPQFGVADASVRNYLIRAGVTLRPATRQQQPLVAESHRLRVAATPIAARVEKRPECDRY